MTSEKKLLKKIDESDKEFTAGFTELKKAMSTVGTSIQQSVGTLSQLVGHGMPNYTRMLSPQTYQDQMHQHQMLQHQVHQHQMHQQQMHQNQITYQQRRAYSASSTITSPNHNYNHTVYVSSRDDITDKHNANEKEYQNL